MLQVDYELLMAELELMKTGSEETVEEKKAKMRKWKERQII